MFVCILCVFRVFLFVSSGGVGGPPFLCVFACVFCVHSVCFCLCVFRVFLFVCISCVFVFFVLSCFIVFYRLYSFVVVGGFLFYVFL